MKVAVIWIFSFFFTSLLLFKHGSSKQVTLTCGEDDDDTNRGASGPPGKKGPTGSTGQKGERGAKGDKGQSDESFEAIARMEERLLELERALHLSQRGDCSDVRRQGYDDNGLYNITLGRSMKEVYCDFTTERGNWLVIQRRVDGELSFYRTWDEYREGFGKAAGEFWLGLDSLYLLTNAGSYSLRVDMEDWEGNTAYAEYSTFIVGNLASNYRLTVDGFSGDAGDSLNYHNGLPFTTRDNDNDEHESSNCANVYQGAWWYKRCHHSNLNGRYFPGGSSSASGVDWRQWKATHYSLKHVEMKIRRKYA